MGRIHPRAAVEGLADSKLTDYCGGVWVDYPCAYHISNISFKLDDERVISPYRFYAA